jgi:hypothetical protein
MTERRELSPQISANKRRTVVVMIGFGVTR